MRFIVLFSPVLFSFAAWNCPDSMIIDNDQGYAKTNQQLLINAVSDIGDAGRLQSTGTNNPGSIHLGGKDSLHNTRIDLKGSYAGQSIFFNSRNIARNPLINGRDTPVQPVVNSVASDDQKIIMSAGNNSLEFSPANSSGNSVQIEPINRTDDKGISTVFYLKDTSSWSFYTDSKSRLTISGDGSIRTSYPVLINNAIPDGKASLRVNGIARIDSSIFIGTDLDSSSFISIHRNVKNSAFDPDDRISPYTTTPLGWTAGNNLPVFRIRHPNSIVNSPDINTSVNRDFMILPYQYGMAIEYNGVVECWVGEWSIHKGLHYNDTEGKGNGWGGVLWVGDDIDAGGVRSTARNNTTLGGNVAYGELSVEKFTGAPNGDLRLRLPSTQNQFQFVYGERGSENVIARLTNEGLIIPKIATVDSAVLPQKAQIVFDSTERAFKGYNGNEWVDFSGTDLITGSYTLSANGTDDSFFIPHGLSAPPLYYNVIATSQDAGNFSYVTANATHLIVHYTNPPAAGIVNLSWNWQVKR